MCNRSDHVKWNIKHTGEHSCDFSGTWLKSLVVSLLLCIPGMSESEESSSGTSADTGFSPVQLAVIAGVAEKVLSKTLTECTGSRASRSSRENGCTVDAVVRQNHSPPVRTLGDSSESAAGEEREKIMQSMQV